MQGKLTINGGQLKVISGAGGPLARTTPPFGHPSFVRRGVLALLIYVRGKFDAFS
jgi:hypothetical protein